MYQRAAWSQHAFPFIAARSGPDYCNIIGIRKTETYIRVIFFLFKYFVKDMILSLRVVSYLIQILSNRHNNAKSHNQSLNEICAKSFPFSYRNFSILSFKSYEYLYIRPQLSQVNKYAKFHPHSQILYHSKLL